MSDTAAAVVVVVVVAAAAAAGHVPGSRTLRLLDKEGVQYEHRMKYAAAAAVSAV